MCVCVCVCVCVFRGCGGGGGRGSNLCISIFSIVSRITLKKRAKGERANGEEDILKNNSSNVKL